MFRPRHSPLVVCALLVLAVPALAGDVSVVKKGKTLVVSGSETPDDLTFTNSLGALTGDGDGPSGEDVAVTPGKETTINGAGAGEGELFQGIFKIKIAMEDGADVLAFQDFNFAGSLKLSGEDGAEVVSFVNCNLDGAVKLDGDDNDDEFSFESSNFNSTFKLISDTGVLTMNATGCNFDNPSIIGGPGADVLTWIDTNTNLNLKVNASFGDDVITLSGVGIGEDTSLKMSLGNNTVTTDSSAQFGALVSYKGGPGDDALTLTDTLVGESLVVKLGPGNNSVTLVSDTGNLGIGESLVVKGGPQDDTITFTDGAVPSFGIGGGSSSGAKLSLATGVNTVTMTGLTQMGLLTLTAGALDDTVSIDGGQIQGVAKILVAAGNNSVTLNDTECQDDLVITAGSGDDTVTLSGTTSVAGDQKINLDGGNNTGP